MMQTEIERQEEPRLTYNVTTRTVSAFSELCIGIVALSCQGPPDLSGSIIRTSYSSTG